MLKARSIISYAGIFVAIAGLFFVVGCGNSLEKQKMTEFVQILEKAVSEYANADDSHKVELAKKVETLIAKWNDMKVEMGSELTPQVLDKLDIDYKKFAKKFKQLSGKS